MQEKNISPLSHKHETPPESSKKTRKLWNFLQRFEEINQDLCFKCPKCRSIIYRKDYEKNLNVCMECQHYGRLGWQQRLQQLLDPGTLVIFNEHIRSTDPLAFHTTSETYADKLQETYEKTGLCDGLVTACGKIQGYLVAVAVTDFAFMGASMGSVFGEKFVRLIDFAIEHQLPLLTISSSGGARMHEGLFSLMQMAKTVSALVQLGKARLPHIAVLVDPCYGGVAASYTMTADVILAEKGAMIGFAGPRVIEQTTRQVLPEGFQTAEFLLEHGMIDQVVERKSLVQTLSRILCTFQPVCGKSETTIRQKGEPPFSSTEYVQVPLEYTSIKSNGYRANGTEAGQIKTMLQVMDSSQPSSEARTSEQIWQTVQLARHAQRPHTLDFILRWCQEFIELRGDRCFGDDQALIGGLALFEGKPIMVIGHQKGHDTKENIARNFGMPHPEGYRKAVRLLRLAAKFSLPVLCLIDTPGAYPGLQGEERSVAQAIAESLWVLADLPVPIVSVVIGEGGSGGALALGLSDRILMLENSIYAVASPEASASILWRDAQHAPQAATAMKVTANELLKLGLIDEVVEEPKGGAHSDREATLATLKTVVIRHLEELEQIWQNGKALDTLLWQRQAKFRAMGSWQ